MVRRIAVLLVTATLAAASLGAAGDGDPLRRDQYGLEAIDAPGAWATARGGGAVIAIVDTGVHLGHPDLQAKLLRDGDGGVVGFDAVDRGAPHDGNGHGTLVAGTAAAATDNGVGIASVAPDARLMPVRVLDDRGRGSIEDVDRGIRWAVDNGADVINLSLESFVPLPGQVVNGGLDAAVRYAWDRGVVVVAAAGNSGTPFTDYAASTPVLLVGATNAADRQTTYSDSGRRDMVLAPGADIVSTACSPCGRRGTARYASASGTSFAAPHVAGAIAVLRSAGRSPAEAVAALRETAVPVPKPATSTQQGHGRIDLGAAVRHGSRASAPPRSPEPSRPPSAPASDDADEPARSRETEADEPAPSAETDADVAARAGSPTEDPSEASDDEDVAGDPGDEGADETPSEEPAPPPVRTAEPPAAGGDLGDVAVPTDRRRVPGPLILLAGGSILVAGTASLRALDRD